MRTLRLAKAAAQAEGLRLREMAQRQARRAILGLVATLFLVAFLIAGHIAIGLSLMPMVTPLQAVLVVGAGDLLIALVFGAFAIVSKPGLVERQALELRERVVHEFQESMTVPAMMGGIARTVGIESLVKLALSIVRGRLFRRKVR